MNSDRLAGIKSPLVLTLQVLLNVVLGLALWAEFGGLFWVPVSPGENRVSFIVSLAAVGLLAAIISGALYLYRRRIPLSLRRMIKSPTFVIWLIVSVSYALIILCISLNRI